MKKKIVLLIAVAIVLTVICYIYTCIVGKSYTAEITMPQDQPADVTADHYEIIMDLSLIHI